MAAPVIAITTPESGKAYTKGQTVTVAYTCTDATECVGAAPNGSPMPNGSALDTATVGASSITVTARDAAGASSVAQSSYNIVESGGDPGANDPATLNITLGTPTPFSAFIPGVAQTYSATLAAEILSTAGDATLSVADPSDTNTGKLVNGAYTLVAPVQVGAVKGDPPAGTEPSMAPLGGNAAPTSLLTYDGPVNDSATVTFKQAIRATDALRTGAYSKTLTFTLSTTNP